MPEDWQPGNKAIFAYKNPKKQGNFIVMRVNEVPNGKIEVELVDTQDNNVNVVAFIKMIDSHGNYCNLDEWLPKTEFIK